MYQALGKSKNNYLAIQAYSLKFVFPVSVNAVTHYSQAPNLEILLWIDFFSSLAHKSKFKLSPVDSLALV